MCQATGDPKPRVTWNKKGKKVNSQRFEVSGGEGGGPGPVPPRQGHGRSGPGGAAGTCPRRDVGSQGLSLPWDPCLLSGGPARPARSATVTACGPKPACLSPLSFILHSQTHTQCQRSRKGTRPVPALTEGHPHTCAQPGVRLSASHTPSRACHTSRAGHTPIDPWCSTGARPGPAFCHWCFPVGQGMSHPPPVPLPGPLGPQPRVDLSPLPTADDRV